MTRHLSSSGSQVLIWLGICRESYNQARFCDQMLEKIYQPIKVNLLLLAKFELPLLGSKI